MALTPVRHIQTGQGPQELLTAQLNTPFPLLELKQLNFMQICWCSKTIQGIQLNPASFHFQPNSILMQVTRS